MLDDMLQWRLETVKGRSHIEQGKYDVPLEMNSYRYIQVLKTILIPNDVTIDKLTSYLLYQLQKRLKKSLIHIDDIMSEYRQAKNEGLLDSKGKKILEKYENGTIRFLCEMVKFVFFVFKADTRMSTSIRTVSILDLIIGYAEGRCFKNSRVGYCFVSRNELYKTVQDEIVFLLKNNKLEALSGLEFCNVLSIMNDLPSSFAINNKIFQSFIGDKFDSFGTDVNFLMAFALLKTLKEPNRLNMVNEDDIQRKIVDWLLNR